jgi:hypothetical protein
VLWFRRGLRLGGDRRAEAFDQNAPATTIAQQTRAFA